MGLQLGNHKNLSYALKYQIKSISNIPTSASVFIYCFRPKPNNEIPINYYLSIF